MQCTYIWIEGYENLDKFCLKRFGSKPKFVETIGHVGDEATVHHIYKRDKDGHYHDMFLLFMPHHKGEYNDFELYNEVEIKWDYEKIRSDKRSILKG